MKDNTINYFYNILLIKVTLGLKQAIVYPHITDGL